jgi:hypothetical protein
MNRADEVPSTWFLSHWETSILGLTPELLGWVRTFLGCLQELILLANS